jgi:hypothetical protein
METFDMAKESNMHNTEAELKAIAKAAGSSLKRAGHQVPHSVLLHALSAALNKRDWHKLKASLAGDDTQVQESCAIEWDTSSYSDRTRFFLRLAVALGNPVDPVPKDDVLACNQAVAACGESLDGILKWHTWNLPASLALRTSGIDAGAFKHEEPLTGRMHLSLKNNLRVDFEVAYTPGGGWYLTSRGSQQFYEQLERAVPRWRERTQQASQTPSPGADVATELPGPPVKATFWTDDRVFTVEFDARPYLMRATDEQLLSILEVGFSNDESTDWVAEYVAENKLNAELVNAFAYIGALRKALKDPIGFECSVDVEGYYRWMDAHRRAVLARALCFAEGIIARRYDAEAAEGDWGWERSAIGSESVIESDKLFDTQDAALLDAYTQLNMLETVLSEL